MPPKPTSLCEAPREVDLVLAIGLAKRPYERFESATQFANAFRSSMAGDISDGLRARGEKLEAKRGWERSLWTRHWSAMQNRRTVWR